MLQRVGSGSDGSSQGSSESLKLPHRSVRTVESRTQQPSPSSPQYQQQLQQRQQQQQAPLRVPPRRDDTLPVRTKTVSVSCCDAGTDPLESLMGESASMDWFMVPRRRVGHETETQTTIPPAPIAVPKSASTTDPGTGSGDLGGRERAQSTVANSTLEAVQTEPESQIDSEQLDKDMKSFLMHHLSHNADIDNNRSGEHSDSSGGNENQQSEDAQVVESPRIDPIKMAEQRQPPNARSRQGYRSFRMPTSRPTSSKAG